MRGIAIYLLPVFLAQAAPAQNPPAELPTAFSHDFRKSAPDDSLPRDLRFLRVDKPGLLQFQEGGLLIKVPKTHSLPKGKGLGLETDFGLSGDFEITVAFDNFQAELPASGSGVGFGIYLRAVDDAQALFSRLVQPNNTQVLKMNWFNKNVTQTSPCTDTAGKIRLKRTGTSLDFQWAPGTKSDDFASVFQCDFGNGNVLFVQLNTTNGGVPCDQEVRVLDLRFRGQRFSRAGGNTGPIATAGAQPVQPPSADPKSGLAWALLVGLLVTVAFGVGLWLIVRRRRAKETAGAKLHT
jgi:hypothetical protein